MGTILCRSLDPQPRRQGLRSRLVLLVSLLTAGLVGVPALSAQETGTITGRVTDAVTAQPLASAQVTIPELQIGVLTQQNGRFILLNVPAGTHTVTVQRIGYRDGTAAVTVVPGESVTQDFQIEEEALALDEIIVTGTPGGTQRRALGNSVARVNAAQIAEQAVVTNVQEMLAGRTPGLRFGRVDGQVGGGSGITIRGVASVSLGSQPLIYIDGVRVDNSAERGPDTGSASGNASALSDLNPEEIESIEVIKGPSAATLYGTEASAGVIQIITKRGQIGAPEFTLTTRQGAYFMPDPEGMLGTQYYCQPFDDGRPRSGRCPDDLIRTYNIYAHERDYNGNEVFQYGHGQGYNLSVRGGTDQVRYFLSGDWSDDQGVVAWNYDESLAGRANITVLFGDALTVDVNAGYVEGKTRYESATPGQGGVMNDMKWARGERLNSVLDALGLPDHPGQALRGFQEHTPEDHAMIESTREYNRFTGSIQLQHTVGSWLTQRLVTGLDKSWDTNTAFHPLVPGNQRFSEFALGQIIKATPEVTTQTVDYGATARLRLTESIGTATSVGLQYNARLREQLETTGRGFSVPVQTTVNQTAQANLEVDYDYVENKSFGVYVQEELSLNDRLFLTAAVRADDNSTFGSDFDLVYYPKFSLAWVISEEPFWNMSFINSMRLRAAWGEAGRQPDALSGQFIYVAFPGPGGSAGLRPSQPGNPLVGPERTSEIEAGLDIALLNDRLSGEFTYFDARTRGAITDDPIAPSYGFPGTYDRNLGEIHNWGFEGSLDARVVERPEVAFDLGGSVSYIRNEVVKLGGSLESPNFQEGHPYPAVVGTVVLWAEPGPDGYGYNPDTALCDGGTGRRGNLRGGEPVLCSTVPELQLLYGPSVPPWTFTLAPTLTLFSNLQLFLLAEGQYGGWFADIQTEYAHRNFNTYKSLCKCDPIYEAAQNGAFDDERYNGRVEARFWKAREFGFRYNLPPSLLQRFGPDRASISVSARNWWTIWNGTKTDLGGGVIADPESRAQASGQTGGTLTNTYAVPGIANISASLRVTF